MFTWHLLAFAEADLNSIENELVRRPARLPSLFISSQLGYRRRFRAHLARGMCFFHHLRTRQVNEEQHARFRTAVVHIALYRHSKNTKSETTTKQELRRRNHDHCEAQLCVCRRDVGGQVDLLMGY